MAKNTSSGHIIEPFLACPGNPLLPSLEKQICEDLFDLAPADAMISESDLQQQSPQRQVDDRHHHGSENPVLNMHPHHPPVSPFTLNEILDTVFKPEKTFNSVNRDEFFTNMWSTQEQHASSITIGDTSTEQQHHHHNSLASPLSQSYKSTIDLQAWTDMQCQSSHMQPRHTTGELTFQDFLVKASVEINESIPLTDLAPPPPPASLEELQQLQMAPMVGNGRKRLAEMTMERMVERVHRRTIKNRESAARSRARKQVRAVELEMEHTQLREENNKLRQEKLKMKEKIVEAIDKKARENAIKIRRAHGRCISCSW